MQWIKRAGSILSTILVIVIVAFALLLAVGKWTGFGVYTVLSGSMEPTYPVGSLLLVKEVPAEELLPGDPVTFLIAQDTVVTHRITEVVTDEADSVLRFRTKGDGNDTEDAGLLHENNVIGKPVFSVPKLGYLIHFIQHPPGTYITIAVCAALLLISFIFPGKSKKKEER